MNMDDFFGKLDDILFRPVDVVCKYLEEPLNALSAGRERKTMEKQAEIQMQLSQHEAEVRAYEERQAVELAVDQRRWNAEIDEMIAEQESKRRDQLVESIKRYQIDLATATRDIVNSIGLMSIELRRQANALVMEKTQEYRKMQNEATESAMQKIEEIDRRFAGNERVRIRMEDSVMEQMDAVVDAATRFINELADDFKRLNQNTDDLMRMGMENVNKYLEPMAKSLQVDTNITYEPKQLEDGSIVDLDKIGV